MEKSMLKKKIIVFIFYSVIYYILGRKSKYVEIASKNKWKINYQSIKN